MKSGRVPHVLFRVSRISPDLRKIDCDLEERAVNLSEKEGERSRRLQGKMCVELVLAYRKERKCSWLGRRQLSNCLEKQVGKRGTTRTHRRRSGIKKLGRNVGSQQGKK